MTLRALIIDDEPLARAGVTSRLRGVGDIEVAGEFADGRSALAGIRSLRPDVVFVDVQMPGMSGLDMLAALPSPERPIAILLTAYEVFAVRAFELNVIDYLLKPIDEVRFAESLDRARQVWRQRHGVPAVADTGSAWAARPSSYPARFSVRIGPRAVFIEVDRVNVIEADGDYAALHVDTTRYLLRESLQRLTTQLDPRQFVRIHRSMIVRISHIAEMQPLSNRDAMLRLRDGRPVRASRTYIAGLLDALCGQAREPSR